MEAYLLASLHRYPELKSTLERKGFLREPLLAIPFHALQRSLPRALTPMFDQKWSGKRP
jgi:hypothetical protein